ncbi:hypothetical protein FSP39_005108 [Pinctada imbricata]|uniref:Uncharacterized protein n=1 Tax=Pinctada imbricata TaxID=66713 RepID=A0AA88XTH7_PINIB|nr:hypothetical protein FSP39_005108 [Pinctada imbricata]
MRISPVCSHQSKLSSYAFVNVHSEHQAEFALDQLSSWDRRRQLQYNFTLLCESSQPLKAAFKLESPNKHVKKKKKKKKTQMH